jgi:hypothetical protein
VEPAKAVPPLRIAAGTLDPLAWSNSAAVMPMMTAARAMRVVQTHRGSCCGEGGREGGLEETAIVGDPFALHLFRRVGFSFPAWAGVATDGFCRGGEIRHPVNEIRIKTQVSGHLEVGAATDSSSHPTTWDAA